MPKLLDAVGLAGRAKNLAGQLSGGRRQRADLPRLRKVLAFRHVNLRYGPGYGYNPGQICSLKFVRKINEGGF